MERKVQQQIFKYFFPVGFVNTRDAEVGYKMKYEIEKKKRKRKDKNKETWEPIRFDPLDTKCLPYTPDIMKARNDKTLPGGIFQQMTPEPHLTVNRFLPKRIKTRRGVKDLKFHERVTPW